MLLYLVQHAEAKKEEEDPERGLTDKGFRDIARAAVYAQKLGVGASAIYHSGKKRAAQTAKVLADYLKPEKGIVKTDGLAPMDDPNLWSKRIAEMNEDIMLAGHLPYLAKLAGLLLCGDKEKMFVDFRMAGIVCLNRSDDGKWALSWMIVTEMIA
ncbi:MAG TPA: phosphohistidine phosphatase SixA [Nitrospirota bacterium]|nr:phosphohistidine phosphatase SixA [Nitrospirota bacterium]